MSSEQLRLTIEPGSDPIAGSLGLPDGRAVPFEGYLQLVAFLEGVRARTPGDGAEPATRHREETT